MVSKGVPNDHQALTVTYVKIGPKIFKKGISSVIAPGALSVMV